MTFKTEVAVEAVTGPDDVNAVVTGQQYTDGRSLRDAAEPRSPHLGDGLDHRVVLELLCCDILSFQGSLVTSFFSVLDMLYQINLQVADKFKILSCYT